MDALWLSHLHPDHCSDLLAVFSWAVNAANVPPMAVYGPPGWAERLAAMLPIDNAESVVRQTFEVHELRNGHTAQIRDLRLTSLTVEHTVPAFGLRAETAAAALAYSGDTGPCPALIDLAREVDLLVCEAGAVAPQPGHCTPQDTGRAAAQAHARRLVVTHIPYSADPTQTAEQASRVAGCPTSAAVAGTTTSMQGTPASSSDSRTTREYRQ